MSCALLNPPSSLRNAFQQDCQLLHSLPNRVLHLSLVLRLPACPPGRWSLVKCLYCFDDFLVYGRSGSARVPPIVRVVPPMPKRRPPDNCLDLWRLPSFYGRLGSLGPNLLSAHVLSDQTT